MFYVQFVVGLIRVACGRFSSIGLVLGGSFLCVVLSLGIGCVPCRVVYVLAFVPVKQQSPGLLLLFLALVAIAWVHVESLAFGAEAHLWWLFLFHLL